MMSQAFHYTRFPMSLNSYSNLEDRVIIILIILRSKMSHGYVVKKYQILEVKPMGRAPQLPT